MTQVELVPALPVLRKGTRWRFDIGETVHFMNTLTGKPSNGKIVRAWTYMGWPHFDVKPTHNSKSCIRVPQIHCSSKPLNQSA